MLCRNNQLLIFKEERMNASILYKVSCQEGNKEC